MWKVFCVATVAGLSLISAGCGSGSTGPKLHAVSGQVTFDGEPLANGSIQFKDPEAKTGSYFAKIENGSYQTEIEAGKRTVEISAIRVSKDKMVPNAEGTGMEPASEQYIPKKYNEQTTLEIDVTPSGPNTFPFDLTSQ